MAWEWMILGLIVRISLDLFTNAGKHRGYINRIINKITKIPLAFPPFLPIWLLISWPLYYLNDPLNYIVLWTIYIIVALDDYLNGDDDLHKKIKRAVNKIKWKMTQPKLIARPQ